MAWMSEDVARVQRLSSVAVEGPTEGAAQGSQTDDDRDQPGIHDLDRG